MPDIRPGIWRLFISPWTSFGLNCYNRVLDCADATVDIRNAGGNYLDNGSELYPKAIYDAIHILNDEFKIGIPIYITENRTSNCNETVVDGKVHDLQRIEYVRSFLEWIKKAIDEGADIRGYYLWSFLDNYRVECRLYVSFWLDACGL